MSQTAWNRWLAGGVLATTAAWTQWAAAQSAPLPPATGAVERQIRVVTEGERTGDFLIRLADGALALGEEADKDPLPTSDYWIGIALGELPEVAKLQLGLASGLVVSEVMEDSPAAKAQFKPHDILIKAGDAKLQAAGDLIKAVDAAKEKELAIVVVRGGKEQTIKVTPIKRPKSEAVDVQTRLAVPLNSPDVKGAVEKLREALQQLESKSGSAPLGLMLARPAVVPPPTAAGTGAGARFNVYVAPEFPKNLTIQITKKGDQPANIRVEKDGKNWDVTEGKLNDLPEDVRVHVQHYLGQRATRSLGGPVLALPTTERNFELHLTPPVPALPGAPAAPPVPPAPARTAVRAYPNPVPPVPATPQVARLHTYRVETAGGGVEGKLDAILKKLDQLESKSVEQLEREVKQLRKELDELRSKSPGR